MIKKSSFKILFLITEIVLLSTLVLFFYLNTKITVPSVVFIPKGSINKIVTHLNKKGLDINRFDSFILRIFGFPQSGYIDVKKTKMTKGEFLYTITHAKTAFKTFSLIPGQTTYIMLKNSVKKFHYDFDKLQKYYNQYALYQDGIFFAQTYKIPLGFNEKRFVKFLINKSMKIHKKLSNAYFGKFDKKKWFRIITIASIIQKESANKKEMPIISSVIYNRLKKGMKLQMDGALNYGKYSNQKVTPLRIKYDKSQFNTYKHKGLPSYPVCIVGFDAIDAAINPKKTNYLYFVRGKGGTHLFSTTYQEHLKNIKL